MSYPMVSKGRWAGAAQFLRPLAWLVFASTVSVVAIGASVGFVGGVVADSARATLPATTTRQAWYSPAKKELAAGDLDIARFVPVSPQSDAPGLVPVAAAKAQDPQPAAAAADKAGTHQVATEVLRVRSGPDRNAAQLFTVKGGTRVTLGRDDKGWVEITLPDGRSGWVYGKFLTPLMG